MIHPVQPNSEAWRILRCGKPTASGFDNLVTPEGKIRTGKMPETYLHEKVAEAITGLPTETPDMWQMQQGVILETEAIPYYELMTGAKVQRIGFITDDQMRIGCSPDGCIGEDGGLECKAPQPKTQVKYLLEGTVPPEYICQIQGSLYVSGRKWWDFLSYSRKLPPMLIRVFPDPKFHSALAEALANWLAAFDSAIAKIEALKK